MATVYVARDRKHGRQVAIKVLRPELAELLGADRFLREIEIAANLVHPHILPLHDSGEADGLLYYVMPYIEGESLRARLEREKQLPVDDALRISRQVLSALGHAHSRGIIHRDIKPENILLSAGEAIVADFGVARAIGAAGPGRLTTAGMSIGTPGYMSPEQAVGSEDLDARSDIYSVACMLHEMLAGEAPFTGPLESVIEQHLTADPPPVRQARRTVPEEIEQAILTALHKTPADRFRTAADFTAALDAGVVAAPEVRPSPRAHWLPGIAVGAAMIVGGYLLVRLLLPGTAAATPQLDLAIFPFRTTGPVAAEYTEAAPDLLATALDGTPGLSVADPWSLWRPLRPDPGARAASPDPDRAGQLATEAGARQFVLGALLETGDSATLTLRVYEPSGAQPVHTVSATGTLDALGQLVQRGAVELIARLTAEQDRPDMPSIERLATSSASALKAYLRAKEAMRRGAVEQAEAAIDTALALDSAFAIALVDAIVIKSWTRYLRGEFYTFGDLADRAERLRDSLTRRNQLRLDALVAAVRTDGARAAEAAGRIIEMDSTDLLAWHALAYYDLAYGWQYGADVADAAAAADRALQLDSTYIPAVVTRATLAPAVDDSAGLARQVAVLEALDTTNAMIRTTRTALRAVEADDQHFPNVLDTVVAGQFTEWLAALRMLRAFAPARAERLLGRVTPLAGPGQPTWALQGEQARLWIAEGRLAKVDSAIRAGDYRTFDLYRTLQRFLVTATMAGVGDSAIARRAVDELAAYVPLDSAAALFQVRPVWWTGWVVGAYHAMYGDTTVTHRWHEMLGRLPDGGTPNDYRAALQADLEARLAVRRGDPDAAIPLAERAYDAWSIHTENDWEALAAPAMRFHLAMLLRGAGQPDRAEGLLRSLIPPGTWMGFLTARASLELGSLAEERGAFSEAAQHYARALRLWELGGEASAAWRAQAEQGVTRALRRAG